MRSGPIFTDENVFPLKISVNDSFAVSRRQTMRDLDAGDVRSSVIDSRGAVSPSLKAEVGIGPAGFQEEPQEKTLLGMELQRVSTE